jgi:diguanylate cyclase (GGDEF)-like protein
VLRVVRRRGQQSLEEARSRAAALATSDQLTGLLNRRGFELVAEQALAVARRSSIPVMALFCDLDGLKPVNDTLGHHAGDALLVDAARRLGSAFRDADAVGRFGGDEFAVLLINAHPSTADQLRDRVRGCMPGIGVSVGAAVTADPLGTSLDALLEEADAQMYAEKQAKRAARRGGSIEMA